MNPSFILQLLFKEATDPVLGINFRLLPAKKIIIVQHLLGLTDQFMDDWAADVKQAEGDNAETIFFAEVDDVLRCIDFLFERIPNEDEDEDRHTNNATTATATTTPATTENLVPSSSTVFFTNRSRVAARSL